MPLIPNFDLSYQVKQIVVLFYNLIALTLGQNRVKGLRVTKNVKEIKFEEIWGKLVSRKGFQRQSVSKYLRLTLVFTLNSTLREKFNCYFSEVFPSMSKIFIFAGRLGTSLPFCEA